MTVKQAMSIVKLYSIESAVTATRIMMQIFSDNDFM